jgi:hypothetical protein
MKIRTIALALTVVISALTLATPAGATEGLYKRTISYQSKQDLFYNYYEGPDPSGTTAAMYISPRPVPAFVGHTYVPYQPFMPHEYMYRHTRTHYAYNPGAGWSRAKVRYRTAGLRIDHCLWKLSDCY